MKTAALGVKRGHRARAIDADQPISLGTADRRIGERQHVLAVAQRGKALFDGSRGHRLQPQPLNRLGAFGVTHDITEDQLAFAARVTGVDQAADIFALDELGEELEPSLGLLNRLQVKVRWNHRQVCKRPFAALDLELVRHGDFDQVADGGGQHKVVVFKVIVVLFKSAQHARDIAGHGRFLGDN